MRGLRRFWCWWAGHDWGKVGVVQSTDDTIDALLNGRRMRCRCCEAFGRDLAWPDEDPRPREVTLAEFEFRFPSSRAT